ITLPTNQQPALVLRLLHQRQHQLQQRPVTPVALHRATRVAIHMLAAKWNAPKVASRGAYLATAAA
ncbi:MAG: hypothetical protein SGJ20_00575, partial [Planctomycetota bacterium]|nr:hypothetical protein [Planctomycetota bacterium]